MQSLQKGQHVRAGVRDRPAADGRVRQGRVEIDWREPTSLAQGHVARALVVIRWLMSVACHCACIPVQHGSPCEVCVKERDEKVGSGAFRDGSPASQQTPVLQTHGGGRLLQTPGPAERARHGAKEKANAKRQVPVSWCQSLRQCQKGREGAEISLLTAASKQPSPLPPLTTMRPRLLCTVHRLTLSGHHCMPRPRHPGPRPWSTRQTGPGSIGTPRENAERNGDCERRGRES